MSSILIHYPNDAVIFDVDGLLIDSELYWRKARDIFMQKKKIDYDMSIDHLVVGMGVKEIILFWKERIGLTGDTEKLMNEYRQIFYSGILKPGELHLTTGARELIGGLFGKKPLAIATGGHTRWMIGEILKQLKIYHYFRVIVSSDEVPRGKPHPDIYFEAAKRLGVPPGKCLVLEDAVNGIASAKKAGMIVFGVNTDAKVRKELTKAGANKVFKSLDRVKVTYFF